MPDLEVRASKEALILGGGDAKVAVRIRYRERGTRRWTRVLVIPQEGQTIGELMGYAARIAADHKAGKVAQAAGPQASEGARGS